MNQSTSTNEFVSVAVLIDTWWNVNSGHMPTCEQYAMVLIDTWWNVNTSSICKWFDVQPVLIDTWWNVNQDDSPNIYIQVMF